jgi:hypothetical protein
MVHGTRQQTESKYAAGITLAGLIKAVRTQISPTAAKEYLAYMDRNSSYRRLLHTIPWRLFDRHTVCNMLEPCRSHLKRVHLPCLQRKCPGSPTSLIREPKNRGQRIYTNLAIKEATRAPITLHTPQPGVMQIQLQAKVDTSRANRSDSERRRCTLQSTTQLRCNTSGSIAASCYPPCIT